MPVAGYVIINGIVWLLCAVVWLWTKQAWGMEVKATVERPATASILLFVVFSFLLASVYDYAFDGFTLRLRRQAVGQHEAGSEDS